MAKPLVIAHRGASAEKPENTLAAFRRALALGVDGIELDVQLTRDGVPVVFHDASLRRLTGVPGRLAVRTWRDLKKLRVQGTEPIPRLADVLALVRGRAVVQIELKRGAKLAPVVRAIRRARAEEWVILASFELTLVRQAGRLAPGIPRMLIAEGRGLKKLLADMAALARIFHGATATSPWFARQPQRGRCGSSKQIADKNHSACEICGLGAVGLSLDHRAVRNRSIVGQIHRHGGTVWCWTVNSAPLMRRLAARGVDAIISDNPALLRRTV